MARPLRLSALIASSVLLALAAGCTSSPPPPDDAAAREALAAERAQHAQALEKERTRAGDAEAEARRLEREGERLEASLAAAQDTNRAQATALTVAMDKVREQAAALASVGSATPAAGGDAEAAAALLRLQQARIDRLQEELAKARAVASGQAPPPAGHRDTLVRVADLDLDTVVTTIDGEPLTRREFCEYLYRDQGTPGLLEMFANRAIVLREARQRGLAIDDVTCAVWVEEQLVASATEAGSEAAFEQRLHEQGFTPEAWRARLRYQARPQLALQKLVELERTTPEGRDAFEARLAEVYERDYSERCSARHIVVACRADAPAPEVEAARAKAGAILAELQRGVPFADVAKRRSEDRESRRLGGALGTFDRTRFRSEPDLCTAFFTLPPGTPAGPIRSTFGFHVVLVDQRTPPARAFDAETRRAIIASLEREPPSDGELRALIERLRARSHIAHSLTFD